MKSILWLLCAALAAAGAETNPVIYVIGDSTASNADRCGWGDPFVDYFDDSQPSLLKRRNNPQMDRPSHNGPCCWPLNRQLHK